MSSPVNDGDSMRQTNLSDPVESNENHEQSCTVARKIYVRIYSQVRHRSVRLHATSVRSKIFRDIHVLKMDISDILYLFCIQTQIQGIQKCLSKVNRAPGRCGMVSANMDRAERNVKFIVCDRRINDVMCSATCKDRALPCTRW